MQELRLVAVSEDGSYAVLVVPGRSGRFALPIDDRLRTVARGQFSRLAQFEIEVESPLRPKEIQDRIRAGETAEEIADAAGLPIDRIRRFEGPVLAEREFRATEAQRATVRGRNDSGPGPRLGDVVTARLAAAGAATDEAEWDSRKRQDGSWQVQLAYTVGGRMHLAEWVYDPRGKHVTPHDDEAVRLCLDEADWPEPRPVATTAMTATVTPIGSRAAAVAAHQDQRRMGESDRPGGRIPVHPSRLGSGEAPVAASHGSVQRVAAGPALAHDASDQRRADQQRADQQRADQQRADQQRADQQRADQQRADRARADAARADAARADEARDDRDQLPVTPADDERVAPRPARRASGGRARRSSVPSWDEIMFGNSRQPD